MAEDRVWSAEATTPAAVDDALRKLLAERHAESEAYVPARVLNLVVIVDRDWRGEIENRLERVGRFHPSRTIVCAVEPRRSQLDAWASMSGDGAGPGEIAVGQERVELLIGDRHLEHLETIVDPLLVPDLETLVWSPHGHDDAVESLLDLVDVVLIDSVTAPDPRSALGRGRSLLESVYVVDLAWVRSMPWRERIAATFDPERWRGALAEIASVTVRHHPDSGASGALLLGWLASRLGWQAAPMEPEDGGYVARVRAPGRRVRLRLEPDTTMPVPGLAGLSVETASGIGVSLDRGPGGLAATRKLPGQSEARWVVLGASRGESGILGEGIRQALLRDPTYAPALAYAAEILAS